MLNFHLVFNYCNITYFYLAINNDSIFFFKAIQQKLLSVCAERSEDTMEHCRLVLLLLNRFPQSSTELAVRIFH